jgi:hypothetical protein
MRTHPLEDILSAAAHSSAPAQDTLKDAGGIIMDGALRKAFEMGWTTRDRGATLSDALALYDIVVQVRL